MPHVKGNKFKPKPAEEAQPAVQEAAVAAAAAAAPTGGGKRKGKKQRQQQVAGEGATAGAVPAAGDVAVEAAVHAAGASAAEAGAGAGETGTGPPPAKKRRRGGGQAAQQQQLVLPPIPTVVAPAPKPGAAPAAAAAAATSNWAALKAAMDAAKQQQQASRPHWQRQRQRKGGEGAEKGAATGAGVEAAIPSNRPQNIGKDTAPTKVVAVDCEMVGVGPGGERSALARVCIVNSAGNVLLDRFVRPKEKVTDFRTKVSGVRASNLRDAAPFDEVQQQVSDLLKGRIVVGHAIENDLEALLLSHRRKDVRDTAKYPPLMKVLARSGKLKPRALRHLAAEQLGLAIQEGEHSPVDDARAALYLYLKHRKEWERWLAAGGKQQDHPAVPKMLASAAAAAGGFAALASGAAGGKKSCAARMQLSLEELAKKADYMADL